MKRHFLLILSFFCLLCVCRAQVVDYDIVDVYNDLHIECNRAYMINDFVLMKATLDEREDFVKSGKPSEMSFEDYDKLVGFYYYDMGSYYSCIADLDNTGFERAIDNYTKSLDFFQEEPLILSSVRTELAQLNYRTKNFHEALDYLKDNYDYYSTQLVQPTVMTLSQIALCKAQIANFDAALRDIDKAIDINYKNKFDREFYSKELNRKKAKIIALKCEHENTLPIDAVDYYKNYFEYVRDSLIVSFNDMDAGERERYWLRMQPFITDCYRLEHSAPELLYDVTLFSKSILLQFSKVNPAPIAPSYKDVQKTLNKKECAIEFVRYERNGDVFLGALILHDTGKPKFIRMCSEQELLNFKNDQSIPLREIFTNRLSYERQMDLIDDFYQSKDFKRFVWNDEIRKELSGIKKIYFSPDGPFHQLAIEYLYPKNKNKTFYRLTSTRELLVSRKELDLSSMLLCGGVNYFCDLVDDSVSKNDERAFYFIRNEGVSFGPLIGTTEEVSSVMSLRNEENDKLLLDTLVTEQNCNALFDEYPMVLVATHGFFAGNSDKFGLDIKPRTSDMTMSSSVIILAGAMDNVQNKYFNPSHYDGILSAREISMMNLSNVNLFIVSACQSGLGYVTSDGVYGIQRGLKNAGVEALVVSLWEVDDYATKFFMVEFNKALLKEKNIQDAFMIARKTMNRNYKAPRFKNAFVLIDGLNFE